MAEKIIVQIKIIDDGKVKIQFDHTLPPPSIVLHLAKAIQALCAESLVPTAEEMNKAKIYAPPTPQIIIPK